MDLEHINFSELRDAEIVTRMRKNNYEKFKTLVRMHLSFELDLNTDEFDLPCHEIIYEDKGKIRKWNRLSKKHKHGSGSTGCSMGGGGGGSSNAMGTGSVVAGVLKCSSGLGNSSAGSSHCSGSGSPTENLHQTIDQGFLFHLQELKEFLMLTKNIQQEGIFRKTGSASRQNDLRTQIQNDKPLNLEASGYSAHDCATVFKGYLAELPEPLLTDAHYPAHLQIAPLCLAVNAQLDIPTSNEEKSYSISTTTSSSLNSERLKRELHVLNSIQLLLLLLPDENRQLLQHVIEMLHAVALQQHHNKMGSDNLATLFAPHLICPRNIPPEALHYLARKMSSIISYMIVRGQDIFAVPAKLATDIRAYFLERKRKKTMSPEMALDESISDISTVNTVYTFVDREKTAAATTTNNTDTELAQLYAHIQSMPESSKKRRLIKQFNKQNGQGTPLQLQAMNRLKNTDTNRSSKSLSDSIKKHIFHKGIMSRTPKRQTPVVMPIAVLETPSNPSMKHHKQRVLFQSPNPQPISMEVATSLPSSSVSNSSSSFSVVTSLSGTSSSSVTSSVNITPYNLKGHPLQKSISSSSLLTKLPHKTESTSTSTSSSIQSIQSISNPLTCNSSNSSDGGQFQSKSAPVSRQTSSDLQQHNSSNNLPLTSSSMGYHHYPLNHMTLDVNNCCTTPLKIIDKKSVAWDDSHLIDTHSQYPSTPLQQSAAIHATQHNTPSNDLKSRYKSEPNLSLCHQDICETPTTSSTSSSHPPLNDMITPIAKLMPGGKSLTRKLMKGVSMGNLKFPFTTPDSTRRLVRTVSSSLKRRGSDDLHIYHQAEGSFAAAIKTGHAPLLHDMDEDEDDDDHDDNNETFEDDLNDNENVRETEEEETENHVAYNIVGSGSSSSELTNFTGGSASYQQLMLQQNGIYRNLDLVTSTPSLLLGRRSMSPITKSTQRMPKAMQESIMTPRSRKPVMVLTTTVSSTDHNQTINVNSEAGGGGGEGVENIEDYHDNHHDNETDNDNDTDVDTGDDDGDAIKIIPQPEVINEDATSLGGYSDIFKRRQLLHAAGNQSFVQQQTNLKDYMCRVTHLNKNGNKCKEEDDREMGQQEEGKVNEADELSKHFKEYLLSRSVLTANAPPLDSSFSSHSDDYEESSQDEMDDLDENQLSSSLLYCLDGNSPGEEAEGAIKKAELSNKSNWDEKDEKECCPSTSYAANENVTNTAESSTHSLRISTTNRLASNPFVILNNARKRAASSELEKMSSLFFNNQNSPVCSKQQHGTNFLTTTNIKDHNNITLNKKLSSSSLSAENKENYIQINKQNYITNKNKLVTNVAEDLDEEIYPGETSF